VSSLGGKWRDVVGGWEEERRIEFIEMMPWKSREEAADVIESFAIADPSNRVKVKAIHALHLRGAADTVERLLSDLCEEDFLDALRHHSMVKGLAPALHVRAVATFHHHLEQLSDVESRIRMLLHLAELGDENAPVQLKQALAQWPSGRMRDHAESLVRSALDLVRTVDPEWVGHWVAARIADGTLWHEHWAEFVTSAPDDLVNTLLEKIGTEELPYPDAARAIAVLAVVQDGSFAATVFSRICALKARTLESTDQERAASWELLKQLQDLFRALSPKTTVSGIADYISGKIALIEFLEVIELYGNIGHEEFDLRSQLPDELRQKLRSYLKNGVAFVLNQDDFNGDMKMHLAMALARVGDPQDMADLHELIQSDIARVQKGCAAWLRGERGPLAQGAVMSHSNWHVRAVAWLDSEKAEGVLLDLLNEPEYEPEAGWALVRLAQKQNGAERFRHWVPDYSAIWETREGGGKSAFDEERRAHYADTIRKRIRTLLDERTSARESDSFNSRLKALAKILAYVDGYGSAELVMDVMALPGKWDGWTRVEALEALLRSGVGLPAEATLGILNPPIEQVLREGLYTNQNSFLIKRCLCLLPFVDDPSKGIAWIREIVSRTSFPIHELRDVITALGQSRSHEALMFLLELDSPMRSGLQHFPREWLKAIADLGFPEAKRTLLSFIDSEITEPNFELMNESYNREFLASHIAALARAEAVVREHIFQLSIVLHFSLT
jgi:hypothetical protein